MIKVMSFNIRVGTAEDGVNRWENRRQLVIDRIRNFDPDLIGLQECRDDAQADFVKSNLQDYNFYGIPRQGGGDTDLEMAPVLFRKSCFTLIKKGRFWLSETPHIAGSKSWDSVFARTATWVELVHMPSGTKIVYMNVHFDYQPIAIEESARLLAKWVDRTVKQHPVILTGDFNAGKDSEAYRLLAGQGKLLDVFQQAPLELQDTGTFHDYGRSRIISAIDWVLASYHFDVIGAGIDQYHEGQLYPSDHFPVSAELRIKI